MNLDTRQSKLHAGVYVKRRPLLVLPEVYKKAVLLPHLSSSSALNSRSNQQLSKQLSKTSKPFKTLVFQTLSQNAIHIHHRCPVHGPRGHCSSQSQWNSSTNVCARLNCRLLRTNHHRHRTSRPQLLAPKLAYPSTPHPLWRSVTDHASSVAQCGILNGGQQACCQTTQTVSYTTPPFFAKTTP